MRRARERSDEGDAVVGVGGGGVVESEDVEGHAADEREKRGWGLGWLDGLEWGREGEREGWLLLGRDCALR